MKINEIFESIQGEGEYTGVPMLFIRCSGCTRSCEFCDTKYHIEGKQYSCEEVAKIIIESGHNLVCFTGGEPLLQFEDIKNVIEIVREENPCISLHIETNGDLLKKEVFSYCEYIGCSPKDLSVAKRVFQKIQKEALSKKCYDIKVVTDLETIGVDMIPFATCLMPLTTYNKKKDLEIMRKVWDCCVKKRLRYSPRLQYLVYGKKRGI